MSHDQHLHYLRLALDHARLSPPKPTNFRVGCILVSYPESSSAQPVTPSILSTGYTLELPGNTHAEQCALQKLAVEKNIPLENLHKILTPESNVTLYTTVEPCGKRLSGNKPCVNRIIESRGSPDFEHSKTSKSGIRKVVFGAKEPETFVQDSQSCRMLTEAGVEWEYIADLQEEILKIAMEGHQTKQSEGDKQGGPSRTSRTQAPSSDKGQRIVIDNITPEERKRQEALPRNPKKRMMEEPIGG